MDLQQLSTNLFLNSRFAQRKMNGSRFSETLDLQDFDFEENIDAPTDPIADSFSKPSLQERAAVAEEQQRLRSLNDQLKSALQNWLKAHHTY